MFIESDGSLWGMGWNGYGQLGDGTTTDRYSPVKIVAGHVTAIAEGDGNSLFLKDDGSLWGMGLNERGQLGDGTNIKRLTPVPIVASGVTAMAVAESHSLFLKSDGSLWGMGANDSGELGIGATVDQPTPVEIMPAGVKAIATGDGYGLAGQSGYSLFLKSDGSLWGMGENDNGQLGLGTNAEQDTPVQIVAGNVTAIPAGGAGHSLFLKRDGSLWAMGTNGQGQLGDGTKTNRHQPVQIIAGNVTAIAAGGYHSLFLKNDGSLWVMGWNANAQLGDGTKTDRNRPVLMLTRDIIAISGGNAVSLMIKRDGSLWGVGWMGYGSGRTGIGQIGSSPSGNRRLPAQLIPALPGATQALWSPAHSEPLDLPAVAALQSTMQGRLDAAQSNLQRAYDALIVATKANHGGYVEEAQSEVNQAQSDLAAAFAYLKTHPEIDPLVVGPVPADAPRVRPAGIPSSDLSPNDNYRSPRMVDAINGLNGALEQFINGEPGSVGLLVSGLGGYRDKIIEDIVKASASVAHAVDFSHHVLTTPADAATDSPPVTIKQ